LVKWWRFCTIKTMRAQGPLVGDEAAFGYRQEPKRENERQSRPNHRMQPERRIGPEILDKKHQASDDMAND